MRPPSTSTRRARPSRQPGTILASCVAMISTSELRHARAETQDTVDIALEISWITSEIAVDVFGMFFWSALVLLFVQAIT